MTSFIPREWDECGRKDDFVSTVLLQGWVLVGPDNWLLVVIIVGSVVGGFPVLAGLLCLILAFAKGPR